MKNVTFEHVKGVEEAKNELQEVVEFLRSPQKFTALGGKLPKGKWTNARQILFNEPVSLATTSSTLDSGILLLRSYLFWTRVFTFCYSGVIVCVCV